MNAFLFLCGLFFTLITSASADVYQWTDERGVIHVVDEAGQVPPAYRDKVQVFKSMKAPTPPEPLPQAPRRKESKVLPPPPAEKSRQSAGAPPSPTGPGSAESRQVSPICEWAGGSYHKTKVDLDAARVHEAIGRGIPGHQVPGHPGLMFGYNCEVAPVGMCRCGSLPALDSSAQRWECVELGGIIHYCTGAGVLVD